MHNPLKQVRHKRVPVCELSYIIHGYAENQRLAEFVSHPFPSLPRSLLYGLVVGDCYSALYTKKCA